MSRRKNKNKLTSQPLDTQDSQYTLEELEQRMLFSADVADVFLYDPAQANQPANEVLVDENLEVINAASVDSRLLELIFIDANTPDAELLINDLLAREDASRHFEVITLDADRDGIEQITEALGERQGIDAIHIISHGNDGQVVLGDTTLSQDNIAAYNEQLQSWGLALDPDADILIYGCNLAATADGQTLIDNIAALTGADIAASDDLTGHASLGGDWELEYATGKVETVIAVDAVTRDSWQAVLAPVAVSEAWTNVAANTDTSATISTSHTVTTSAGTDRLMLVAFNIRTGNDATHDVTSATFGGVALHEIATSGDNVGRNAMWMGYLLDSEIPSGSQTLELTVSTGGTISGKKLLVATYTGVDQTLPINDSAAVRLDADAPIPFGSTIDYLADGEVVYAASFNGGGTGTVEPTGYSLIYTTENSGGTTTTVGSKVDTSSAGTEPATTQVDFTGTNDRQSLVVAALNAVGAGNVSNSFGTLWLSTDSNVGAPGADGLPGGWTEGQVLGFGGPSLAHGAATDGDLSTVLDFDTFTLDATDPGALHFVSRDMTVGGVNGTFDLKAGDVLVSFLQDETILAAYSDTGVDETYGDQDMLVFRPTSYGNYSSGTFYLLLDEVVADDLKGATLIEQDTTIGGTDVAAGSFLIIAENSVTTSVDLFVPTGVGAGTSTGPVTPFIDISDLGIDANRLRGIEVIEAATTVGGQALAKGDILVTLNVDDNVSGVAGNNLKVDQNDVFVLTLTSTGATTTAGTAAMFLDGSQVGLDDNPSSENPYALALSNYSQLIVDTTSDVSDGDTSSIDALILNRGADGKISLREAIEAANATPNGDTADVIHFNITDPLVNGAHTIMVGNLTDGANGALPDITDAVVIDGTTDLDFSGSPIIELVGSDAGTGDIAAGRRVVLPWAHTSFNIADLNANGETIMLRSLEWASGELAPASANVLFVVQEAASLLPEDTAKKVLMESWGYTVTVIDVNDPQGDFDTAVAANDVVFITKDISSGDMGTKLRNAPIGVVTEELAITDVEFGLNASHSWDTSVLNLNIVDNTNYITSVFGTGNLQVFDVAQELRYMTGTEAADLQTLGTTAGGDSLVIIEAGGQLYNGSSVDGLYITAGNTTVRGLVINQFSDSAIEIGTGSGNVIEGNYIGTDVTGALDPGNGLVGSGIVLWGGTANNVIGGTDAGDGNIIANQVNDGIYLNDDAGTGTTILGNTIYNNGGMGIELVESGPTWGVTANDAGDSDTGANNLQNYPLITTAALSGTDLALDGSLDTDGVATQYRIEFYGNTAGSQDATNGEGRFYLGATTVTTDGSGNASFTDVILSGVTLAAGDYVTATATEITDAGQVGTNDQLAYGDTSEFAVNFAITTAYVNFSVSSTSSISEDVPETATFTVVVSGDALVGANTASVDIVASGSAVSGTDYDNFIAAIASAAGATAGVSFDGTDTLTFDSTFNGNTGLGNFVFTVDAIDDVAMEGTETIVATLSNPGNVGGNAGFGNTVSDSYTEASNTNITAHAPDSGLSWTKVFDNSSYQEAFIDASLDVIQGGFRASSENDTGQAYAAGPAPGSVDQTISFTLTTIETDNGTKPVGLFGRYADDNNFYYLRILPNANGQQSISLWKMAAGTPQLLAQIDATIANGDTFKLEITDASKKVYHNDVEVLSSADNAHTAAGKWGFFIGNFSGIGGHYRDTWQIDDFSAESGVGGSSATTNITESDTNNAPTDLQVVTTEEGGTNVNNDGGNDAYFVADNGGGLLGGLTKVTVESTFSVTTPAADNTTLLSYASGGNDEELGLFLKNDGRIWFTANSAGAPYQSTAGNYMQLFDGEKHQVSVSWDATNGAVDFYIDGAFAESFTGYQTGKTISGGGELVFGQDQDSELGGWNTIDTFSGTFYDVRIFNDVRTLGEVAAGYDQTLPPTEAGMIANWTFGDLSTGGVITDAVSGNNLTLQHASGTGFTQSTPELSLRVAEDAPDLTVVGSVAALDPDTGETFTYSLQNNAGGRFQITAGGDISVANSSLIDFEAASFHDITVRATDAGLLTYDEVFRVYVTNINEAPTVNATASDTGTEDTDQVYTHAQMLTLIGAADVDDADAALTVAITNVVNGSIALSGGTGGAGTTFTFTPTADFVGNMTFDYQVSDDEAPTPASSAIGTATVALSAVNDAPTVSATASDTGTEDTDQVYTHAQMLTLIGAADVDDADAALTVAITNVVNGSVALSGGTGGAGTTFTFTPTANFVGNMTFDYQVSDDEAPTPASSAVGTATVALSAVNDAPTVNATASDTGTEDTDQVYTHAQMLTLIGAADVDDADANLSIAITNVINGSVVLTGGTGGAGTTFTFTPTGDFVGNMTFDYQVSDDESPTPATSAVGTATVALSADNDAPTVNATASDTGTEDTDQVYTHAQMLTLIGAADVDDVDAALSVAITNVINGSVVLTGGTGGAGTTFTFTPTGNFVGNMTFDYQVSDDDSPTPATSAVGTATVALSAVNDAPTVNATASDTGTEDTDQVYTHAQMLTLIGAADVDDADAALTVAITNVVNGSVALSGGTGGAGTTFTFTPTANFVGNMTFDYQVSDDEAPTPASSAVGTATVTLAADNDAPVLDASEANLWLSTSADVSGSTANGLANWSDGDLLRFTAPGLGFGENATNGNFSTSGFNLDNFAGDADIDALHYVSKDILLGSGADTLQLRTGDILFSTESGENLVSTNALSVASKDLVLFRADTPGDYSAGTFTIVLDDPLGGEIKGATLVEQNIWVGDANLAAGSFILSKGDKKLYYYAPVSVGETTTSGPAETTLVDGTGTGVNIDENIFGVHLVQQTTTTGGVTLNAGQLLVTLNNEDNSVGTGPVDTERRDVIVLTITQTGPTTIGDASLFFDGDDVGLASNDEDLDALTLVAQPRLTPIYEDIGNPANTGTLIADLINNIFSDIDGDTVGIAITAIDEAFGTWEYSIDGGSNWLAVGSVSDNLARVLSNSANDLVRFVPSADYSGNAGITFRAWDGSDTITSGTANVNTIPNGGSSAFSTVTVDAVVEVRSVNDPIELNVNATDSTPENTPLVFNAGNANLISITDIDGGAGELEVTLTATTGTVTLGNTTGLTFSVGDGTADSNMTFRGSLADLNTALDGLAYTPVSGYAGATVLNINVEELGNSDLGDNSSAQQSIDIDITPDATNDAPINTVPGTQATNEETPLVLSEANGNGISIVDDSGANPIEVTLTADNGLLTLDNRVGPEFTINATTADTQKEVQILTTATGTGIAVWNSKSLDTSGEGIFGQLYDSNGLPLGDEFQVNTFFADHQSEPDIAAAADGSFIVVWQSKDQDTSGEGIYAQRFDAAGNKVGLEFRANAFTADNQQLPAVAMNASGEFVVTWQSKNQDTSGEGIYAQRYDNAGNTVGGELLVTTIIADNQKNPDVAMDTAGNFVVVWDSKGYDADKEAIVGRRFEVGSGFGAEFQINSYEPGDQKEAVIAMQSTGEFVVAWSSNGQDGGGKGIFAQRFDNSTLPVALGLEIQVNTTTSNNQHIPAISINASGEFTIAWQSKAQDNADGKDGVYARNFAADGSAIGGEFLLNGITVGNQRGPSISLLNDGSVWAAWDNKEIFSQRFQSSQALSFTVGDGIADATMTFSGTQADINAALDGLVYIPNVDFVGADTVTITTNDNGHTGGGSLNDIDAFIINVAGVNDAPVVTVPALQSTTEDIPLVFSTGNGNLVSISDVDADAGLLELSLTATNGSMSLNGIAGLTFSVGDGAADTAMTFQGTVTNINAALDGLSFTSPTDYVGLGQIRLTVDDLGNTGTGGSLVDSAAVYIDITADAVNDAPTIQPPADFALPIDTNVTFDGTDLISILDDADQNSIELTLTVTNGTVTFNEQIDTEHLVNTVFADAQLGAVVAAAPNGSYVIVWQSKNQDGNGQGIFAQVYDAFGNEQGSEIQVNTEFAGNQITPTVAMDSLGNFVVAWESDGNLDGDGRGIFVQMFSAEGQKVDIEFQGNTTANDDQTLPAIGMDDLGNFVLVWQSKNQDGNGEGIFAQRFDANGYALDDEFQVNSTFGNDQTDPAVAVDANGDFVIVWTSTNQDVDGDGIFAQRYDANGVAQGVEFQVNFDGAKHQRAPAVAIDALGNFVVAWQSENQDTNGYGIYARRFDAAGNALDPADVLINTEVNKHQIAPSISMNAVGEYIIAWQSQDQDSDGEGTYGQWFNASGTAIGGEVRLNTTVTNDQTAPSVAITGSGDYIAAWTSKNQDTNAEGIYARHIASPGGLNFTTGDGVDDNSIVVSGRPDRINAALDGMTFTPTPGFNGLATIQIDVDDLGSTGTGGPYTDTHTINLVYNTAPTLDNSGTPSFTAINEDDIGNSGDLVLSIIASGAGGNPIDDADAGASEGIAVIAVDNTNGSWEYSINGGGLWAAFGAVTNSSAVLLGDGANDRIRFVPNANYNGAAGNITFRAWDATDGNASGTTGVNVSVNGGNTSYSAAAETAGITVNPLNDAPVLATIGNQTIDELATLSFTASATDSDDPADTLTYSLDAASLALGMTINSSTGDFSWTPTESQGGLTPSVTITVTDDGTGALFDSETFTITVNDTNTAPVLGAIGNQTVDELATLSFTASATDSDDPADTLTYSLDAASLALGMTINSSTGDFSWTPSESQGGLTPSVTITVTDDGTGALFDNETFTITVNDTNTAPVLGAIGNQTIDENTTLSFTASATDSDDPADTLTYSLDAASLALGMTINSSTGDFSWTPTESQGGLTPSVTITVTDDGTGALFDSETFTITVNDTNTAPVLGVIGNQTVDELATLSFTASATDSDDPSDTLTYSLDAASLALGMTINSSTGDFSWTPTESQGGTTPSVTITVTDDGTGTLFDSETFTITVNDLNTAPVLGAIGNQTIDELSTLAFTATATDPDLPADTLTWSLDAASLALGMTINNSTGDFSWTPTEAQGGTTPSVTITVTDDGTGTLFDSETFTITVNDTNTAPVLGAIGNQTIDELATLSFTASATDSDDPADTLTYSLDAASLALGMTINSSTGDFSWTPTESQGGLTPSVTITVTDDGTGALFDSETFTITVNDTNTAPVLGAIGNQTVDELATLSFTASATDSDDPADTLTYSLDAASLALGMTINSSTGDFSWTPSESQGGLTPSVTITVTDDGTGALFDNETFTITVNDTNTAPVLGAIGNQTIDENTTLSFTASATDSDDPADTLTYSLDAASLALGMTINSSTGDFSWTPTESQGGLTPSVTITVTDDGTGSLFDSETFTITVNDTNTAPVLGAIGNQTIDETSTLSFTASATDSDDPADTLTYSLDAASLALGMTINSSTGDFSWTPSESQGGLTPSVTITVTDDGTGALFDSETFTITVNDTNTAPVLGAIGNQTVDELATLSFTASATDSDDPSDTLTYSLDAASLALGMTINSSTGDFSWTPSESQGGLTPSVTITVTDDGTGALFDNETFTITVNDTNTAPVLGAIGNQTIDENTTLSFTASATDSDDPADTLTYSLDAASLALGMTINSSTGDFSWTPTESQGGLTPSVTITVTDDGTGALFDSETFTITVNDTNTAPVLGAIGNQTVDELATLSFTASATDSDDPADTLTYSLDAASLALGMTINSSTGDFSWTPSESQGGLTPSVTITVTDDGTGALFDNETFTITVNDTNTAPVLGAIGNQTIDENTTLSFTASATDSDDPADTLTYSLDAASLALGMTINSSTGDFSWTPTESQGGLTPSVTITVTDDGTGALFDSETFTITVNDTNTAPVLGVIGNQTVDELATLSFTASATDSDDPSDTLTYSLDAASLALGMTINSSTGDFSWTPTESQGGTTPSVTITVTDDGTGTLFDSETFTITVNDLNTAPVLGAIGNQTIDELSTLAFTATATDPDLPADTLTWSLDAASLALGMTINNSTGDFSWTPTEAQGGTTPSVTITVTDDGTGTLFDSETFTITVNDTNTAPVLGAIGNQTIDELATLSFTASATDSDDPADTLTYSLDAASLALGMTINSSTGDFSWTPTESQGGLTPSVTITVTDDGTGALFDSETFTITVNDTNTAPVLGAIGNQTIDETSTLSFTASATDSDDPADTLTYSLDAASLALGMTINSSTGDFSWTPSESQGGTTPSVTITVTDDGTGTLFDSETFTITVNDLNTAPVLGAIGNQTIDELSTLAFTATATDPDLPADTLTWSLDAASLAMGMTINSSTGDFSWTPTEAQGGTTPSVTITVTDDGTGTLFDSETFIITVNEVNNAPVLGAIGNQTVNELVTLSFTATATDSDVPGDNLTYSLDAASLALGMTINSSTGDFSWTPTESQGGLTPSVTITVTDDGTGALFDNETFTITVNDTNTAPVLGAIGNQTVDELATLSFTASATDSDDPADTLTYSLDAASLALGMTINSSTGDFSWTPTESQGGLTPSVTITVTDDGTGSLFDSETFTITVNDTNTAPVLGAIGNQTIDENTTLSFTASATDSDDPADTLTYSLDAASLALGMTINSSTGDFSWTPTESQGGLTPSVTITVTDDGTGALFDSETFTITVNDTNTAPVLGAIGNQTVDELVTLSYTATATDSDVPGDNLTYSLDAASLALGMTINSSTGDFSWTPTETQGGTAPSVTITVTDDGTGTLFDSETFTITVNDVNVAPVLGAIGNQTIDELTTLSFTATATDADLPADTLTFSLDAASITLGMTINSSTGDFSWTPTEAQGGLTPSVTLTVTDNGTGSLVDSETFTITVNDINNAPVAVDDAVTATEDTLFTSTLDLDANDTDSDGDSLTVVAGTFVTAQGGTLVLASDGSYTYNPEANFTGIDSVDYTVTDGSLTDVGTLTITVDPVNDLPTIGGTDTGVVTEDVDPDLDTLLETAGALTIVDPDAGESTFVAETIFGVYGSLTIDAAGAWNYSADNTQPAIQQLDALESVTDVIAVTTADGTTHDVTVTINGAEDAPVIAGVFTGSVAEDGSLTASGALTITDMDTLDNPVSFADVASTPGDNGFGSFELTGGTWTYTLNNTHPSVQALDVGETLPDTHTFTASDGSVQVVTITINGEEDAPVIGGSITGTVTEDAVLSATGVLTITDVDTNDNPVSFLDETTISGDNGFGDFVLSGGTWTYTLNNADPAVQALKAGETLTDTHTVTATDGSVQVLTIAINGADDVPVATDDSGIGFITDEDTSFTTGDVLANDMPGDAPTTVSNFDAVSADGGSVSYNGDGTFTYTPATDFNGSDTFTYTIADVDNDTSTATVTITVNAVNDAPDAVGDSYTLLQNSSLDVTATGLLANDSDVDGDSLAVTLVDGTANGTLTLNSDGTFSYVPDAGFVGDDSFSYLANDGVADSQLVTVLLQVAPVLEDVIEEPIEDTTIAENDDPVTPPTDSDTGDDQDDAVTSETSTDNDGEVDPENLISRTSGWEETTLDEMIDEIVLLDEDAVAELLGETLFEPVDNSVVEVTRADPLRTADRTPRVPFEPNSNLKYGGTFEYDAILNDHALWKEVESMQAAMEEAFDAGEQQGDMFVKVSAGTSLTLTAGFVSYLLRAGTLLSSMLSFLPVWKGVDPLAVLVTKPRKKDKKKNKDEDELENEQVGEDRQGNVDHLFNKGSE